MVDSVIGYYKGFYDLFFKERDLIHEGQYYDLGFEELESDPLGTVRDVYEVLQLPAFQYVEPKLKAYVDAHSNYIKNTYPGYPAPAAKTASLDFHGVEFA